MPRIDTPFTQQLGIDLPIICGPMYPCSNPHLVAAVSEAGGIGVVQPLSFIDYGAEAKPKYDFRGGLRLMKSLTSKPWGMNALVMKTTRRYDRKMREYVDIALEEGCRFFVTSLGNPTWVIKAARPVGGIVYHDIIDSKWAKRSADYGVDGLICVNNRGGGHCGEISAEDLFTTISKLGLPLVCAGGVGEEKDFLKALDLGFVAVQMGTRFIATPECGSHEKYKEMIVKAEEKDIVRTWRVTGEALSVINTELVKEVGTELDWVSKALFRNPHTRPYVRMYYWYTAARRFNRSHSRPPTSKDYYQAGKSVAGIHSVEPAGAIIERFAQAYLNRSRG